MDIDKVLAIVFVIVILSMTSCNIIVNDQDNRAVIALVEQGQSAANAACAVQRLSESNSLHCVNALLENTK